jgi:hypothetical protein
MENYFYSWLCRSFFSPFLPDLGGGLLLIERFCSGSSLSRSLVSCSGGMHLGSVLLDFFLFWASVARSSVFPICPSLGTSSLCSRESQLPPSPPGFGFASCSLRWEDRLISDFFPRGKSTPTLGSAVTAPGFHHR